MSDTGWIDVTERVNSALSPPQYVYRAWDAAGVCIYVGRTNSLERRFDLHASVARCHGQATWLAHAVRFDALRLDSREQAAALERAEIERLRPWGNVRFNTERHPNRRDLRGQPKKLTPQALEELDRELHHEPAPSSI